MKSITKFSFFLLVLATMACSKDSGDSGDDIDLYAGNWRGNVTGEDAGILSFYIYEDGSLTGDFLTDGTQTAVPLTGKVTSAGKISAAFTSGTLSGSINGDLGEHSGNGSWSISSNSTEGSWSASKD